ncbi:nucleotide-binding universal stress UspA family protein [Murinocardiopsis flavida]|uniref:Nucleotide-binding universal stress UspA family protein n=1 Tax=Murinocardiopsis flavida TaxID=645275 RepID=A0A2P8DHP7_9ACTN|nr:universal stress protein [Murinocardiopsis flavida]PSK96742.1 nucleotide-binding universal stress UspA family protein [Murinocardiopsis flavida]
MRPGHVVAGYEPNARGADALALALLLAGRSGARLTVVNVPPTGWPTHTKGAVDAEWVAYLREQSGAALDNARAIIESLLPVRPHEPGRVDYEVHFHRGSGHGLADFASGRGADAVVIGSAPGGRKGRLRMGSTADQLLHGAPVPVVMAPSGFAAQEVRRLERLTFSYLRQEGADRALALAASMAESMELPLRLVTLLIGGSVSGTRATELRTEMLRKLSIEADEDLRAAVASAAAAPHLDPAYVSTETATGTSVAAALGRIEWYQGDLLVCASGRSGPLRRVFLGDTNIDILRAAIVPVAVLPRGVAAPDPRRPRRGAPAQ